MLRFQNAGVPAPVVRRRGRHYADYPYAGTGACRGHFRLGRRDEDLALTAHLDAVARDGGHAAAARPRRHQRPRRAARHRQRTTLAALAARPAGSRCGCGSRP